MKYIGACTDGPPTEQRWSTLESGLIVPSGVSVSSSLTYLQIKEQAQKVIAIYGDADIELPPSSSLASLVGNAISTSDLWLMGKHSQISHRMLFAAVQMNRIAGGVLGLRGVENRAKYLRHLTDGDLSPFERGRSLSKDILWELELCAMLKDRSMNAVLEEPPDIVVSIDDLKVGIACKKLYSTRNVEKVLSEGVAQIESAFEFGMIALNLDELLPSNALPSAPTRAALSEWLTNTNLAFLRAHERHFRKYLSTGRVLGALVSTGGLADAAQENPRLLTARQFTTWVIPGLSDEKMQLIHRFRDQFMLLVG
jgi:hypothetical protein